jgi:hypothetical protein
MSGNFLFKFKVRDTSRFSSLKRGVDERTTTKPQERNNSMKIFRKDSFTGILPEEGKTQKTVELQRAVSDSGKNPLLPEDAPSIPTQEKGVKGKTMSKSRLTYELHDELVFSENHNFPIDDVFRILLKNIQRNPECKNKVPVLTVGRGHDVLVIYPLARARAVMTKSERKSRATTERNILKMVMHR